MGTHTNLTGQTCGDKSKVTIKVCSMSRRQGAKGENRERAITKGKSKILTSRERQKEKETMSVREREDTRGNIERDKRQREREGKGNKE